MKTKTIFTVRYAETDQMGIVHHSNYAIWFEAGRTDFFKTIGISNTIIESKGVLLPLYEMNIKFIFPAKYEDEIVVITKLKSLFRSRIVLSYEVRNVVSNKLLATGETMHAWTNKMLKPINAQKVVPEVFATLYSYKNKIEENDFYENCSC